MYTSAIIRSTSSVEFINFEEPIEKAKTVEGYLAIEETVQKQYGYRNCDVILFENSYLNFDGCSLVMCYSSDDTDVETTGNTKYCARRYSTDDIDGYYYQLNNDDDDDDEEPIFCKW